jgi:hypothetical protein
MEVLLGGTLGLNIMDGEDTVDWDKFFKQNFSKIDTFVGNMAKNWPVMGVDGSSSLLVKTDTGMKVKVQKGTAVIRGHFFSMDADQSLTIEAAHATLNRIDRVVLRLDWATGVMNLAILKGTPGTIYAAPVTTNNDTTWEMSLAQISVDAAMTSIVTNKIADERKLLYPEYGSNSNGEYVKYPDGTMICWFSKTVTSNGGAYYSQDGVPFPAAFSTAYDTSKIKVMIVGYNTFHGYSQNNCNSGFATAVTNSAVRWGLLFGASVTSGYSLSANMIAIGRWQ